MVAVSDEVQLRLGPRCLTAHSEKLMLQYIQKRTSGMTNLDDAARPGQVGEGDEEEFGRIVLRFRALFMKTAYGSWAVVSVSIRFEKCFA